MPPAAAPLTTLSYLAHLAALLAKYPAGKVERPVRQPKANARAIFGTGIINFRTLTPLPSPCQWRGARGEVSPRVVKGKETLLERFDVGDKRVRHVVLIKLVLIGGDAGKHHILAVARDDLGVWQLD